MSERNYLPRIDRMWAGLSVDEGGEGVIGRLLPNGTWLPFVAADPKRLLFIREQAQLIAMERAILVRVVRFDTRTDLEEFDGRH